MSDLEIGWEIRHYKHGWGTVIAIFRGVIQARFADGKERYVQPDSIIDRRRARRELQRLKDSVKALLESGNFLAADESHQQAGFGDFWPESVYQKAREDQRRHFHKRLLENLKGGDLAGAERIWTECCSSWMKEAAFLELILSVLAAGFGRQDGIPPLDAARCQNAVLPVKILERLALALDLESDGQQIREIGLACDGRRLLLHDQRQGTDLTSATAKLAERIAKTPLLVGHNLLAWDWPILARHLKGTSPPLIWDTLLIGYLLEPQATSHALGSSHRADQDALDTLLKFQRQLHQLPPGIAVDVLSGRIRDFAQLLDAITDALTDRADFSRPAPDFLGAGNAAPDQLTIVPPNRLREVDWVPGIRVVSADPDRSLAAEWGQLYPPLLRKLLAGVDDLGPNARTLLAVVKLAAGQNIPLRRNMIPYWLLDRDDALTAAMDRACLIPKADGGRRIAPFPERIEAWAKLDPSACVVLGPGDEVLLLDRRALALAEYPLQAGEPRTSNFLHIGSAGAGLKWLRVDRAAQMLEPRGGLIEFSTLLMPAAMRVATRSAPALPWRPKFARHVRPRLYPHALDQGSYWTEVLLAFRAAVESRPEVVPVLLVTSSASKALLELLATGLAEIGLGESRPEHRSRREHLRRAAAKGYALVDTLEQWPTLLNLAQSANLQLQPVVEALPLEEWYARAETRALAVQQDPAQAPPHVERAVVSSAALAESTLALVRASLQPWISETGLSAAPHPLIVLDPRVEMEIHKLSGLVEALSLPESPLPAAQVQQLALALSPMELEREEAPSGLAAMERFLVANWNPPDGAGGNAVTGFKPSQRLAMEAICERNAHVLVALPTGEGKSVLFQVPALCRGLRNRRLTLVLSPLKALMRDQVERLRDQGFADSADYLSGDRSLHERTEVIQGVLDHRIVLLYIAPERLRHGRFLEVLQKRMQADGGLEHLVVDETHSVNQWGYEFRPDYFSALTHLLKLCRDADTGLPTPFILLSATITSADRACLQAILAESPLPLVARPGTYISPLRSHITVEPRRVRGNLRDRDNAENALAERLPPILECIASANNNRTATGQRSAVIVFVSSRKHAELVAQRLAREAGCPVDYYHAGLDSGTREEIYTGFLEGELNVLVATKAFGMGMDIPDIHWVVHLSPPAYLEDYLQEVGRIGRGEQERRRARLEQLSAMLLFSNEDFDSIRELRVSNALTLPGLKDFYETVCENTFETEGKRIAVVPAGGYREARKIVLERPAARRAAETRVRMSLYWLERARRLRLLGSVADLVDLTANPAVLAEFAGAEGQVGKMAELILGLCKPERPPPTTPVREQSAALAPVRSGGLVEAAVNLLGGLVSLLASAVGLLYRSSPRPSAAVESTPVDAVAAVGSAPAASVGSAPPRLQETLLLSLSTIRQQSDGLFDSVDDVLAVLIDLEKAGAVRLNREVEVVRLKLFNEPGERIDKLFKRVDVAVAELLHRLAERGRLEFDPQELVGESREHEEPEQDAGPKPSEELQRQYAKAFINGFRSLARASGIRLRQRIRTDEKTVWEATLPKSLRQKADSKRQRYLETSRSVRRQVAGRRSIPVSELIETLRDTSPVARFRESDLRVVLGLLSTMKLVGISSDLLPLSHVVEVLEVPGKLEEQVEIWNELRRVNELAEARNLAMEMYVNLPVESRANFIEGYFAAADGSALRAFLDTQLGEIAAGDPEGASGALLQMQEKIRATQVVAFFERFRKSEEPAQWEVAKAPYDRHILVNAGPGAGKTFVLVGRIAHLIREQNVEPARIIVLAFNRAVVFEIRKRIQELFRSLGYARYASRLRVSTFHSLALRSLSQAGVQVERKDMETLLPEFARQLSTDPAFARKVAGGVHCILVDEFQDMTDDVYQIIRLLHSGSESRAGVMVIGDDDQDILRWQRIGTNRVSLREFSEEYFDSFVEDFGGEQVMKFELRRNFRSDRVIVEHSQQMISGYFARACRSRRLKASTLIPRNDAGEGHCQIIDRRGDSWDAVLEESVSILEEIAGSEGESTAVLCRSNAEVAAAHRVLSRKFPNIMVQGAANLNLADLRHVGLWLDQLRESIGKRHELLSEDLRKEMLARAKSRANIPDFAASGAAVAMLDQLWALCCREHSFPHLSSLIRFVEELQIDEFVRLSGVVDDSMKMVVSTLHKVKGLEFDNVLILPSFIPFGLADPAGDAAAEARLLYVGMTRAKKRLEYFWGDRDSKWIKPIPERYKGLSSDGNILTGSMEDVALGWAMQKNDFNRNPDACQHYIPKFDS